MRGSAPFSYATLVLGTQSTFLAATSPQELSQILLSILEECSIE
jgi:hypothetical protein